MYVERKFLRNYLTKRHNDYGLLAALIFIALCLIISNFYWFNLFDLANYLSASHKNIFDLHEFWRLFTTTFVHGNMKHLLANSMMLFILIYMVTSFFGVFAALVMSILMGGVINAVTLHFYPPEVSLVGASGVLYYLWGFWLVLYLGIETQKSFIARLVRVIGVFFILLVPTSLDPSVSYLAHYSGFSIGVIIGAIFFLLKKKQFLKSEVWEERIVYEDEDDYSLQNAEEEISLSENILH